MVAVCPLKGGEAMGVVYRLFRTGRAAASLAFVALAAGTAHAQEGCKRSLDGTIVARTTPEEQVYDLIFETQAPIAKLALRFTGPEKSRVITNAPGENQLFNFTQNQTATAMTCVQINKIARERVLQ
jgi:hypothetical protein